MHLINRGGQGGTCPEAAACAENRVDVTAESRDILAGTVPVRSALFADREFSEAWEITEIEAESGQE
jgi:hypothetical protein